jgi:putative ABC transport system ATP-binding protein
MPFTDTHVPPIVELSGVCKVFQSGHLEQHALADVHLEISNGEYIAIVGPSGSGKTTLLSVLGLLDVPSTGSYKLRGIDVNQLSSRDRGRIRNRDVGFIFQSFNLIGDLTVRENVELPLRYRDMSMLERRRCVKRALERVEMSHREGYFPSELSGGEQQRVAVARAVAGEPAILFADEPTGSLDSKSGRAVMDLLDELHAGGGTVCIVTHDAEYAKRAQRVIRLFDGRVVEDVAVVAGGSCARAGSFCRG